MFESVDTHTRKVGQTPARLVALGSGKLKILLVREPVMLAEQITKLFAKQKLASVAKLTRAYLYDRNNNKNPVSASA